MKSRITKTVTIIALIMAITITVSAIGKWSGSEYVEESHTYITQIKGLFKVKNDEIKELKEDNKGYDKVIKDLQKEIKDKNKVIEDRDKTIADKNKEIGKINKDLMDAKATIKIQKDELDYALQDVKDIRDELKTIVEGEQQYD